ncbi:MAG: cytochrome c [Nitriliruptoraceae bacterium]
MPAVADRRALWSRRVHRGLWPFVALAASLAISTACSSPSGTGPEAGTSADIDRGASLFANHCAACHGSVGQGTSSGPPLVHIVYEPGHHSDASFHLAVTQGVRAHHWEFGDMPPVVGLDRADVDDIIAYVRDLQREAGIID